MRDLAGHLQQKHGYPILFLDRQWLLRVLHEQLKYKERVLLNKKVAEVFRTEGGVSVVTKDGSVYKGTIGVGADGIHSAVREEMFRIGNELQPGCFSPESVPCYYQCSFGIAQNVPGWVAGEQNIVVGKGQSQLVASGPENRVYWFLFRQLPEPKYDNSISKYTDEDEAQFAKAYVDFPITDKVTFGQLHANRLSSTLTALHEVVYKKWFYKRIIIFGDAAHKPNPVGGQGGNGAIESAAEFINAIVDKKNYRSGSLKGLTENDIQDILARTQSARHERAEMIVRVSHQTQSLNAYENPILSTFIWKLVAPFAGDEDTLRRLGAVLHGGTSIKHLPIPRRPGAIPFDDELPASPVKKMISITIQILFIASMGLLFLSATSTSPQFPSWMGDRLYSHSLAKKLVPSVSRLVPEREPTPRTLRIGFSWDLISPIMIYIIEGYRIANKGTLLSLPSLFMVLIKVWGINSIAPLHAGFSALQGSPLGPGRFIPPELAKAFTPALTLGYVVPIMLLILSMHYRGSWQMTEEVWRITPCLVSALTWLLAAGLGWWRRRNMDPKEPEEAHFDRYKALDVPILKSVYTYAFAIQAGAHISRLAYVYSQLGASTVEGGLGLSSPIDGSWDLQRIGLWLSIALIHGMPVATAAWLGHIMYSIWDLRRSRLVKTREAIVAALLVVVGYIVVGPGATWAALWYWREGAIAGVALK